MAERIAYNQWNSDELRERALSFYTSKVRPRLVREEISDAPIEMTPEVVADVLVPPPSPDESLFTSTRRPSLETELHSAIEGFSIDSITPQTAKIIFDLESGKKPVHSVRAGLTEDQLLLIWTPLIDAWWNALGDEKRKKFVHVAHEVVSASTDAEEKRVAAQKIGYRRMLDGIFVRNPHKVYEIFDAVKNGRDPFCPEGFKGGDYVAWKNFLKTDWFSSLSADEKIRLAAAVNRQKTTPALIKEKEAELALKLTQLKKVTSISGKVALFFNAGQEKGIVHPDFLEREILELRRELLELGVSKFIDHEIAQVDARQQEVADKVGFGSRVFDATRRLFSSMSAQEKTNAPQSLRGKIFGGLTSVYYNVPGVIQRWMLEAGCSYAARASDKTGISEKNNETAADLRAQHTISNAEGRPEVDWAAYALALQYRISIEISRVVQKSQALKVAVEREPLAGLLRAYKEVVPRIAPALREKQERVNSILVNLIAQTDQDLRARASVRGVSIQHLVTEKDTLWIQTFLEDQRAEDENRVVHPTATGEHAPEAHKLSFTCSMLVGPQHTTSRIVRELAAKFDTSKSATALNRDTLQFLTEGWVFEQNDSNPRHLMSNGTENIHLYVGDRVVAVQNDLAPLGFHLKIERNPAPHREGCVLNDRHGNPEWYYQRTPNKTVYAWKISKDGHMQLAGHFEGKKFVEHQEKMWSYADVHGKKRQVGEFANGVYFTLDGTVVSKNKSHKGSAFTKIGNLTEKINVPLTIRLADGTTQTVDSKNKDLYITPAGNLVEYHGSVNEMRQLGALEREA